MSQVLQGRVAIVTGANQGLGLAIARAYAQAGASLMLCARNATLLDQARQEVATFLAPGQRVEIHPCDVSQLEEVQRLVAAAVQAFGQVHILVNNAGIYGPFGMIDEVDWMEWVRAIEINFLGSVLLCRALLPHFRARRYGKIVQLSGGGATNPLPRISAYAASKAAIVRFAESLALELAGEGIDVNAIAPGALNTRLLDDVLAAGPAKVGQSFYDRAVKQKEQGGAPISRGADLAVFLGSAASDGITGKLLSAVWDPWEDLPAHREELQKTDVYTLRRIVPADRGMTWEKK
jgi:NAD(P)-dependent dehydrogenase (short-subunit alcohol dehydrogenase family)